MDHPKSHNSASPGARFCAPTGAPISAVLGQSGEAV